MKISNGYPGGVKCCAGTRRPFDEQTYSRDAIRAVPSDGGACVRPARDASQAAVRRLSIETNANACFGASSKTPLRVVGAGDTMLATSWPESILEPRRDGKTLIAPDVAAVFRAADFAFVNAESPFCDIEGNNKVSKNI